MKLNVNIKKIDILAYGAVFLWAVVCLVFFLFYYHYHFFYQEQNQLFLLSWDYVETYLPHIGWLANLIGDFLTQFYYYLYAGPIILTGALLTLGDLTRRFLQQCHLKYWSFLVAILLMTVFVVFSFRYDYHLSNIISAIGLMGAFWLVALLFRHVKNIFVKSIVAVLIIGTTYWLFGIPKMGKFSLPNFYLEKQFAVDNEYYFGNYERVIEMVENDDNPTPEMLFFYNLVQAKRHNLPNVLLKYIPNDLGTFYRIGPKSPMLTIKNMNELYWELGDMTFTERAAMMGNVFSENNRNVRMIKRLAEVNLVSGDTLAMNKYMRILNNTWVYAKQVERMKHDERLLSKRQFVNRQDTMQVSDNLHMIMMELLDSNPNNTIALQYMLCSDLLL
ncbi:MAG: hypothetical protein II521_11305, partial [Prevotella sp.]|nr:hypothetical protein [Prevotella sp.]